MLRNTALGAVAAASDTLFAQRITPPNIVFILADDLGYADVSCYGRPDLSTPNIDRIAAEGVRFLQAYANSAVCSATRTRADHRPLSVSAAGRAGGAARRQPATSACRRNIPPCRRC